MTSFDPFEALALPSNALIDLHISKMVFSRAVTPNAMPLGQDCKLEVCYG